jgi:hypothetical protein
MDSGYNYDNGYLYVSPAGYPSKTNVTWRPRNLTGNYDFFLDLEWSGSSLLVVTLPITIEYELIDD